MTLLTTILAACAVMIIWYSSEKARKMKIGTLCLMYWGASLMWLVDAIVEYASEGVSFFSPTAADMLNDLYLGLSVTALGLVIWLVILLVADPCRTVGSVIAKLKK